MLSILVATPTGEGDAYQHTRLLRIVRDHRTKNLELTLPDQTSIVSLGWVPEITYEATELGYSLNAIIRPDLSSLGLPRNVLPYAAPPSTQGRTTLDTTASPTAAALLPEATVARETPTVSDDRPLYEVAFRNREICVNGFRLSRPNFNSENEVAFDFLFKNANRRVELAELEAALGRPLSKKLREIIRDLGFRGELRDLFFPGVSKTAIEFVNPVTAADFLARDLRPPQLDTR